MPLATEAPYTKQACPTETSLLMLQLNVRRVSRRPVVVILGFALSISRIDKGSKLCIVATASVLAAARGVFGANGYAGTSVDDLVDALNLHRGSMYKAFGSKRGLLVAVLTDVVTDRLPAALARGDDLVRGDALDLVLVAAADLGPHDTEVAALVRDACQQVAVSPPDSTGVDPGNTPVSAAMAAIPSVALAVLGARLIARMDAHRGATSKHAVPTH